MRVFIAESKTNIRYGLRVLLGEQPDLEVVGESAELDNILLKIKQTNPDLLIMSWDFPISRLEELIGRIRLTLPRLPIIALSVKSDLRESTIQSGVNDFIWKGDPPEKLISSIQTLQQTRRIHDGNPIPIGYQNLISN
jgi:DNA-binding NarL/FixJ family response regulator